jgi:energy-converting hydrogenase Eha subunit E
LIVAAAAFAVVARPPRDQPLVRSLALPLAFFPVGVALIVTTFGPDVLITRYTAVAGPFMLVLVAAVVTRLPQAGAVAAGVAVLTALAGSVAGHTDASEYLDWRGGTRELARQARADDGVLIAYQPSLAVFQYYAGQVGLRPLLAVPMSDPRARELFTGGRRVWIFNEPALSRAELTAGLALVGYRPRMIKRFEASEPLGLTLAIPRG